MTLTLSSKCTIIWNILEISLQCTCCKMFAPEDWTFIGVIHRYTKGGCVKWNVKINVTQSWGHPPVPGLCYHWFIIISRFWCHPVTVCSLGHSVVNILYPVASLKLSIENKLQIQICLFSENMICNFCDLEISHV